MRIWLILASMTVAGAANGKASEMIYAQELVNRAVANHPDIVVIAMHVAASQSGENTVIASNIGGIGKKADADDLQVIKTGVSKLAVNKAGDRFEVELVLKDANYRNIGALVIVFPYQAGADRAALKGRAEAIRDELARHISHRANLLEPAQYDSTIPTQTYGQSLVDDALRALFEEDRPITFQTVKEWIERREAARPATEVQVELTTLSSFDVLFQHKEVWDGFADGSEAAARGVPAGTSPAHVS